MKLLDNLFRIVEVKGMSCQVSLNANHEIYKAHFPGNPITPGVCIAQMATEIFEEITHQKLSLTEVKRIKYLGLMKPEDKPLFAFNLTAEGKDSCEIKVSVSDGEKIFSQMTLCYNRTTGD